MEKGLIVSIRMMLDDDRMMIMMLEAEYKFTGAKSGSSWWPKRSIYIYINIFINIYIYI